MQKMRTKYFPFCAALFLCLGLPAGLFGGDHTRNGFIAKEDIEQHCGVNAMYVALRLSGLDADYGKIRRALQPSENSRVSVSDIEGYLKNRRIKFRTIRPRPSDAEYLSGKIFIVFTPPAESSGIGHFSAMRIKGTNIQYVDPAYGIGEFPVSKLSGRLAAIVLNDDSIFPFRLNAYGIAGIAILAGALLAALLAKLYGKKSKSGKGFIRA